MASVPFCTSRRLVLGIPRSRPQQFSVTLLAHKWKL
jgi:hypothetical protein